MVDMGSFSAAARRLDVGHTSTNASIAASRSMRMNPERECVVSPRAARLWVGIGA
jgi:hypothetical protein